MVTSQMQWRVLKLGSSRRWYIISLVFPNLRPGDATYVAKKAKNVALNCLQPTQYVRKYFVRYSIIPLRRLYETYNRPSRRTHTVICKLTLILTLKLKCDVSAGLASLTYQNYTLCSHENIIPTIMTKYCSMILDSLAIACISTKEISRSWADFTSYKQEPYSRFFTLFTQHHHHTKYKINNEHYSPNI